MQFGFQNTMGVLDDCLTVFNFIINVTNSHPAVVAWSVERLLHTKHHLMVVDRILGWAIIVLMGVWCTYTINNCT